MTAFQTYRLAGHSGEAFNRIVTAFRLGELSGLAMRVRHGR
jgi:hypothetical protein